MDVLTSPTFLITFAVIQTIVFLLLIRFLDLYEHEPLASVALVALWGAVGAAAIAAALNPVVRELLPEDVDEVFGSAIAAPIVEEIAKGIALLAAFGLSAWAHARYGFKRLSGLTDGIVYGAAIGLGFAFTEDIHYLMVAAASDLGEGASVFALRRDFLGMGMLHHALFSAAVGAGIGLAAWSRSVFARVAYATLGLVLGMLLHASNNGLENAYLVFQHGSTATGDYLRGELVNEVLLQTHRTGRLMAGLIDYVSFVLFAGGIALWLDFQRKAISTELAEEVTAGLIDQRDAEIVPRFWHRIGWYWTLVRVGQLDRARMARRLHIELANLALMSWRQKRGLTSSEDVDQVRQRVADLKAALAVDVLAPDRVKS